jgi:hypothetical protein
MGRKKMDRANSGEQNNETRRGMSADSRNESLESENGMESDRAERTMTAGARGDAQAGDEGLDDPAMSRSHRDDMSATPMQGDKLESQRMQSQRSERTQQRANDERFDNAEEFSGQGGQKEGSDRNAEGTGYTSDER